MMPPLFSSLPLNLLTAETPASSAVVVSAVAATVAAIALTLTAAMLTMSSREVAKRSNAPLVPLQHWLTLLTMLSWLMRPSFVRRTRSECSVIGTLELDVRALYLVC